MIIGKVVGTVICTRKNDNLIGSKFMIIEPLVKMGDETLRKKCKKVEKFDENLWVLLEDMFET
ncbi:MAG: peptide deformylase, partial [Agathobacter sp.]|nr:peptide deformylase [Agathobacter sp.]